MFGLCRMEFLNTLSVNPIFFATSMVSMQLGSRHIFGEITPQQEKLLMSPGAKLIITFFLFFVYSKDITLALILASFFTLTVRGIMNERKKYNVVTPTSKEYVRLYKENFQRLKNKSGA